MEYNWISLLGIFEKDRDKIIFKGGQEKNLYSGQGFPRLGNYLSDQSFGGGEVELTINFPKIAGDVTAGGIMICYDSDQRYFICSAINIREDAPIAFSLQHFDAGKWTAHDAIGDKRTIKE